MSHVWLANMMLVSPIHYHLISISSWFKRLMIRDKWTQGEHVIITEKNWNQETESLVVRAQRPQPCVFDFSLIHLPIARNVQSSKLLNNGYVLFGIIMTEAKRKEHLITDLITDNRDWPWPITDNCARKRYSQFLADVDAKDNARNSNGE